MAQNNYYELLKHPKWQKKRLEVLEAAHFECEHCGEKNKTLHVHHKCYKKGLKPWEYSPLNLICLCDKCHAEYHEQKEILENIIGELGFVETEELLGFAKGLSLFEYPEQNIELNSAEQITGLAKCWDVTEFRILDSVDKEPIDGYKLKYLHETKRVLG